MSIKYKMYLYYLLYLISSILIKIVNPCKIQKNSNGEVVCMNTRGPCCNKCKHLSNKGCTVKALSCKLWLCDVVKDFHPILYKILKRIMRISTKNGIYYFRYSKQETFYELNTLRKERYYGQVISKS